MLPLSAARDKDFYSLLSYFCQEQGLAIDKSRLYHSLGKLILSDGEIYTVEETDAESQRYKLAPFALLKRGSLELFTEKGIKKVAELGGNDLEYVALNTPRFPLLSGDLWENWSPLNRHDGHERIYSAILSALGDYLVKAGRILVIGCGDGSFLDVLAECGYDTIGIDSNPTNVGIAVSKGRTVQQIRIEEAEFGAKFEVIIDPGILSAGVVERSEVELILPKILAMMKSGGYFIHAPFSRSLLTSKDLENLGLVVYNKVVPANLFSYELPKQFYIAKKGE